MRPSFYLAALQFFLYLAGVFQCSESHYTLIIKQTLSDEKSQSPRFRTRAFNILHTIPKGIEVVITRNDKQYYSFKMPQKFIFSDIGIRVICYYGICFD